MFMKRIPWTRSSIETYRCLLSLEYSTSVFPDVLDRAYYDKKYADKHAIKPERVPIIESKRPDLNYYGKNYGKQEEVPCVSTTWSHKKSNYDYFIIRGNASREQKKEIPLKYTKFEELGLDNDIVELLDKMGITTPTEVQVKGIPKILQGLNVQLTAETGCGKTLAYALPIIQQVKQLKRLNPERDPFNNPLAIIISPSRDLTRQISTVIEEICKPLFIDVQCITGGHTKRLIMNPTFKECDILVASVGSLSKLITAGVYKAKAVTHVVLDEADSLLDDSFSDKIVYLLSKLPFQYKKNNIVDGCQLTVVSATMPHELPDITSRFVNPESIKKIITDNTHKILSHVPQKFVRLRYAQKPIELLKLIKDDDSKKRPVMIFSNTSATCDWISLFLNENKINCININGNMPYDIKVGKYALFKTGQVNVLSCTDIASRGLDTTNVQHILNYDFPPFTADYIHRCGRTGRIGSAENCRVTNFVASPREISLVQKIELSIRRKKELPKVDGNIPKLIGEYIMKKEQG